MSKTAIVYFSGKGHTESFAKALAEGVNDIEGAEAVMYKIPESGDIPENWWDELAEVDGIVYGSPTYMGMAAWQFKKFADESVGSWYASAWRNKVAGGFTVSASVNGDKHSTMSYLATFAMQHAQIWIGTGLKPANKKENGPEDVNWTAGFTGALGIAPANTSAEEAPRSGDLETARIYGRRIAQAAKSIAAVQGDWSVDA
ncbi:MAG: flavodoxin family protein [Pseudomonadota bacterium]